MNERVGVLFALVLIVIAAVTIIVAWHLGELAHQFNTIPMCRRP